MIKVVKVSLPEGWEMQIFPPDNSFKAWTFTLWHSKQLIDRRTFASQDSEFLDNVWIWFQTKVPESILEAFAEIEIQINNLEIGQRAQPTDPPKCIFCPTPNRYARHLIHIRGSLYICNVCIKRCNRLLAEKEGEVS